MVNKRNLAITVVAICFLTVRANADTDCKSFTDAVEPAQKLIALADADGIGDNSAPRATFRELEISNHLSRIQINLELMQASKCPVPSDPIEPGAYMLDALECATEKLKGNFKSPQCDLEHWTRKPPQDPSSAPASPPQKP